MRRRIGLLIVLLWLLACVGLPRRVHAADGSRPNIVFVLFDDLGWGQPPCYNPQSKLRMPHFDKLASQGMRFIDAHSASAVCTPTRYGVLTGRYPWRIGQFGVLTTYSPPIIPTNRLTVASLLKQQGYATACIGKWHLGLTWADGKPGRQNEVPIGSKLSNGPNDLGFDYFCGFTHARNIGSLIEQDRVVAHVEPHENQPKLLEKTLDWLERRTRDEPFFLYFPMCPPHTPVAPAPEYVGTSGAADVVRGDPRYGDWVYQGDAMLGAIMDVL
jgi:arylsulfatase A-like enzyme